MNLNSKKSFRNIIKRGSGKFKNLRSNSRKSLRCKSRWKFLLSLRKIQYLKMAVLLRLNRRTKAKNTNNSQCHPKTIHKKLQKRSKCQVPAIILWMSRRVRNQSQATTAINPTKPTFNSFKNWFSTNALLTRMMCHCFWGSLLMERLKITTKFSTNMAKTDS